MILCPASAGRFSAYQKATTKNIVAHSILTSDAHDADIRGSPFAYSADEFFLDFSPPF